MPLFRQIGKLNIPVFAYSSMCVLRQATCLSGPSSPHPYIWEQSQEDHTPAQPPPAVVQDSSLPSFWPQMLVEKHASDLTKEPLHYGPTAKEQEPF